MMEKNRVIFNEGLLGTKATIEGPWKKEYLELLLEKNVQELELNDGKGWYGDNVQFLEQLPHLKSLIIIDLNIKSIEPIHSLNGLTKLEIITYSNDPINFTDFPQLLECSFEWIAGSETLFESSTLQKLFINEYTKKDSTVFSGLFNLKELSILNSPIENLEGLSKLKSLNYLRLGNLKNLNSLHGIGSLQGIEELEIQRCKGISDVSEVFKLNKLKRLLLIDLGDITSIHGIEYLTELKDFLFYESTNILDGDLSPLTQLKNLKTVSYQNRRHYSHKREDFGELYFG